MRKDRRPFRCWIRLCKKDAMRWNRWNAVTQCHRCGRVARDPRPSVADGEAEAWRQMIEEGIFAIRMTREYVGEGLLPAKPGWSWFDWTERAQARLEQT